MKVLVTGGAGFIGANLVRKLIDEGYFVRVLDNLSTGSLEYLNGLNIEFIEGDILNLDSVSNAVNGVDSIIHLAAQTGVPGSIENPRHDCVTNVIGTLNMLDAIRIAWDGSQNQISKGQPRFIFASSNAPLGRQEPPATENKAPLPVSPYGASKLASEGYCLAYNGSWGLGTVVLRFGNVYGPFSAHKNSVVAKFIKDILSSGEIIVDGGGMQTRDFIYVEDLCRAILLALEVDGAQGEVFQLATGVETSISNLSHMVKNIVGRDISIGAGPMRRGDVEKNYSEIAKINRIMGWSPQIDLLDGLQTTWEWFNSWSNKYE